jgi:DNA-binding MarR family transcriptional regulator
MARRIAKAGAMSRVRKEARIIDLYENYGYTVKEICSEERVSTTTVSDIIKKLKQSRSPF